MSTAAVRGPTRTRPTPKAEAAPAWRFWSGVALGVILLAVIVAWLLGWISFGTDSRVAEIRRLQDEAGRQFAESGGPRTVAEATAAVAAMNTIRAKTEALPEHLRPQVERQGGSLFRTAMRARIDSYFATPPAQRRAELDRQIDQEEMMRKAFEAGRTVAGMLGGGQPAQPQAGQASGGQASGGQAGSGQGGSGQGGQQGNAGGGGQSRGGSEEERNRWRKTMIDSTTPEQRSRYVEYRRAMDERREQRGLTSGWGR